MIEDVSKFDKSKNNNDLQPEKIFCILNKLEVVKFFKFKEVNDEQSLNIDSIYLTLEVSNFDKSNDFNELQPSNKEATSVTEDVSKFLKFMLSKFLQFMNILFIDFIPEISKLIKSISITEAIFWNNLLYLSAFLSHSNVTLFIPSFGILAFPDLSVFDSTPFIKILLGI